jgi:hypothetical protein
MGGGAEKEPQIEPPILSVSRGELPVKKTHHDEGENEGEEHRVGQSPMPERVDFGKRELVREGIDIRNPLTEHGQDNEAARQLMRLRYGICSTRTEKRVGDEGGHAYLLVRYGSGFVVLDLSLRRFHHIYYRRYVLWYDKYSVCK